MSTIERDGIDRGEEVSILELFHPKMSAQPREGARVGPGPAMFPLTHAVSPGAARMSVHRMATVPSARRTNAEAGIWTLYRVSRLFLAGPRSDGCPKIEAG